MTTTPVAVDSIPVQKGQTIYPSPFNAAVAGRSKRKLGELFGLSNFGVNYTQLDPGSASALMHFHSRQDEFIYVLEGNPTVKIGNEEYLMQPGECIGFKANTSEAHQLINHSDSSVAYLEIGDRSAGDNVEYPDDDLKASLSENGAWLLTHKDGRQY
tara:strand:- start:1227 stop:1697 length:471 start_codon:yes stop_codon:yes gene_type:complete